MIVPLWTFKYGRTADRLRSSTECSQRRELELVKSMFRYGFSVAVSEFLAKQRLWTIFLSFLQLEDYKHDTSMKRVTSG